MLSIEFNISSIRKLKQKNPHVQGFLVTLLKFVFFGA